MSDQTVTVHPLQLVVRGRQIDLPPGALEVRSVPTIVGSMHEIGPLGEYRGLEVWARIHDAGRRVTDPTPELIASARLMASAKNLYVALERFVDRAQSWHNFHHGTDIQCDELCEAIAPGLAALAKARGEANGE